MKRKILIPLITVLCMTGAAQRSRTTGAVHAFVMSNDGYAVIGGQDRAWVAKRALPGDEELFRVQLGSDSRDTVNALASGADGKLYAAGTIFSNGIEQGFLATLDAKGNRVSFAALPTAAYAVALDTAGKVYVAGDDFVLLPEGRRIAPPGPVRALAIDENGAVYAAGRKSSTAETGSYGDDAYVARLGEWVLPLGGTGAVEEARAIAFDASGAVYVAGVTNSVDFPVKSAFQDKLNGPRDAFLVKVLPDGKGVEWATYLGGRGAEEVAAMAVDGNGEIILAGSTNSPDFPSAGRWSGGDDGFVARFDARGKLLESAYMGSSNTDHLTGIAIGRDGKVYVAGSSDGNVLLTRTGRKAGATASSTVLAATPNPSVYGAQVTLTATVTTGATGQVTFYDGTSVLGTSTLSANKAATTTILLPSGSRSLRAYYWGNSTYAASTSASIAQIVVSKPAGGFLDAVNYAASYRKFGVAVGDFNGDGKADLAVGNNIDTTVSILLGNGNGTFQSAVSYSIGGIPMGVAIGDYNGDGKQYIAVANSNKYISILLGNGDGTFQSTVNYSAPSIPYSVVVGDFNGDGKPDLAVTNYILSRVGILLGNGDGTFQSQVQYASGTGPGIVGAGPYYVAVGDFNGDGYADLAVANSVINSVAILLGNGDGTFQAAVNYGSGPNPGFVLVCDFNVRIPGHVNNYSGLM